MKSLKRILVAAAVALLAMAPAAAQVRFGVKAGVALNDLHFNKDIVNDLSSTSNRAGFTGGVMAEVQVPIVGLCIDGSVLYTHRSAELKGSKSNEVFKRDYIDIPVNLKYKFNILGLSNIFTPYLFTGPDFAILLSDKDQNGYTNKTLNTSWNVGFGAELLRHLQVSATYGIGLSKALEYVGVGDGQNISGKDRYWTVTAAYLF